MLAGGLTMNGSLCSRMLRGGMRALLIVALIGPIAIRPASADQPADPLSTVKALHAAWDEYDGRRVLVLFGENSRVATRLASESTPLSLAQHISAVEPFINERMRAADYQVHGTTVTWTYELTNDLVRAVGIESESGSGEAVVDADGKIRSFVLHEDVEWDGRLAAAQVAAYPVQHAQIADLSRPRLAAVLNLDGQWDIYTFDASGSSLTRLTNTVDRESQPVWSPDGKWIAFTYGTPLEAGVWLATNNDGLYVVRSDGTDLRKLAAGASLGWTWSPDSSMLAYSTGEGTSNWFWCTYDTFTVHAVQIASGLEVGAITGAMFPAWANSHEMIVVRQTPDSTSRPVGVEVVNLDTGVSRKLGVSSGWYPLGLSPQADRVVWVGGDGFDRLMVTDTEGGQQTILSTTTLPLRAFVARYAGCTGQREVVTAWNTDGRRLLVQQLDTSDPQKVRAVDPANIPLDMVQLAALDVSGSGQPTVMSYPQLLSMLQGIFVRGASAARTGRLEPGVMESDLGIYTASWSRDGTQVLYAATTSGRRGESLWRFFSYNPTDGTTHEILGGIAPWRKAFLACCSS
jgi:hypothetical protein